MRDVMDAASDDLKLGASASRRGGHRRDACATGMTLVEILVALSILLVLFGIVVMTSKIAGDSRRRSTAQQQMAQLGAAINQYASFWPAWNIGGTMYSQKGWPDFIPARLFASPYTTVPGFNDAARIKFDVNNGVTRYNPLNENYDIVSPALYPADQPDQVSVFDANVALAYQLTAPVGKGPYLRVGEQTVLVDIQNEKVISPIALLNPPQPITDPFYPSNGSGSTRAQVLIDPWGTPLRYFWVYRPKTLPVGQIAYRGFLPVVTADVADPNFRIADGFVLESAGPDKKFGNVWKLVPDPLPANFETNDTDIRFAADNIIISP